MYTYVAATYSTTHFGGLVRDVPQRLATPKAVRLKRFFFPKPTVVPCLPWPIQGAEHLLRTKCRIYIQTALVVVQQLVHFGGLARDVLQRLAATSTAPGPVEPLNQLNQPKRTAGGIFPLYAILSPLSSHAPPRALASHTKKQLRNQPTPKSTLHL